MRGLSNDERELLRGSFDLHVRAFTVNAVGTLVNLSNLYGADYVDGVDGNESQEAPSDTVAVTLWREADALTGPGAGTRVSIAPGMFTSPANIGGPLLDVARRFYVEIAITAKGTAPSEANWRRVFDGEVTEVDAPGDGEFITVQCADAYNRIARAQIMEPQPFGLAIGQNVESAIQEMLTAYMADGAPALVTPVSPGWQIKEFQPDPGSLADATRKLALQIGWDMRYRWTGTITRALTFFAIPRDKTSPDATFLASEYLFVPRDAVALADIRTYVGVRYIAAGETEYSFVYAESETARAKYGHSPMLIQEDAASNIDTVEEAATMATSALSDLSSPYADGEVTTFYFWPCELGDVYQFGANGVNWSTPQNRAIIAHRWTLRAGHGTSVFTIRGKPSGNYRDWLDVQKSDVNPDAPDTPLELKNFRETGRTPAAVTYSWDDGQLPQRGAEIDVFARTYDLPVPSDPWPAEDDAPTARLAAETRSLVVPVPRAGRVTYVELRPIDKQGAVGVVVRVTVAPVAGVPTLGPLTQEAGTVNIFTHLTLDVFDPQERGGTLRVWLNHDAAENADPATVPDGFLVLAETPASVEKGDAFTTGAGTRALFTNVRVHPGRGKRVYAEFVNSEGITSGVIPFVLTSVGGIIDAAGNIVDGGINAARQFVDAIRPPTILAGDLPANGAGFAAGNFAIPTTGPNAGRLMRWTGTAWEPEVATAKLVGQIIAEQIAPGSVGAVAFAANIAPVVKTSAGATPGPLDAFGFDTATGTLLQNVAGVWQPAVHASRLGGQITSTQITPNAITTPLLAANSVTAQQLLADSVVAGKVAAFAINTRELAVGAVKADNIFAEAVTASAIRAGAVRADHLAANTIIAGAIAAGGITAEAIKAKAVKAVHLEVEVLSDVKRADGTSTGLGIIVSGVLRSIDGQRGLDLNAAGAAAFLFHPAMQLRADGSATFSGEVTANSFGALTATFAGTLVAGGAGVGPQSITLRGQASFFPQPPGTYDLWRVRQSGSNTTSVVMESPVGGSLGVSFPTVTFTGAVSANTLAAQSTVDAGVGFNVNGVPVVRGRQGAIGRPGTDGTSLQSSVNGIINALMAHGLTSPS